MRIWPGCTVLAGAGISFSVPIRGFLPDSTKVRGSPGASSSEGESVMALSDRPATLRDVAAAARVHPATASRALNPGTRLLVSEETARRVTEAAEQLGYRPNPVARSLRTRRSHSVDGFVMATATLHSPILAEAAEADLPVVLMNRTAQGYPFSSVAVDNEQGVRAAVTHLTSLGHTRIGHIAGPQEISTGVSRLRGFFEGMRAHDLAAADSQIVYASAYTIEEGLRCGRELLEANRDITAVVAANDMLAVGCYGALDDLGLRCPEDVSVIGFNDMPFIDRLRPPLSTVRFPHYQLGTEAAKLLLERIESGDGPVKILYLAPELVARGSTVPAAPKAVPDLPAAGGPAEAGEQGANTVPLRRGAARRGR